MMVHDKHMGSDPRGLIREAFAMDDIAESEARSIFLDWALGQEGDPKSQIPDLIEKYSKGHENHPMSRILAEGLKSTPSPRRRKERKG